MILYRAGIEVVGQTLILYNSLMWIWEKTKGCFELQLSYTALEQKLFEFYFVKLRNMELKKKLRTTLSCRKRKFFNIKRSKTKAF